MKRISSILVAALAAFSVVSCSKDVLEPSGSGDGPLEPGDGGNFTFTASFNQPAVTDDTRTAVADDGAVSWSKGDIIRYYSTDKGTVRTAEVASDGTSSKFKATVEGNYLVAMHGGSRISGVSASGFTVIGVAGGTQSGDFGKTHLCVAVSDLKTDQLKFTNILSYLRFSLHRDDVDWVEFSARGGESIHGAGSFKVKISEDKISAEYSGTVDSVIVVGTHGAGQFYVATLPETLSKGFQMRFFDKDSSFIGKIESTRSLTIGNNSIINFGELDSHIEYAPRIGIVHNGSGDLGLSSYRNCITDAGGRMIFFEDYARSAGEAQILVASVDAIIVPGSTANDIDGRATCDNRVVREAINQGKPILGICYGHQRVNTVHGGSNTLVTNTYGTDIPHKISVGGRNVGLHDDAYFHKIIIDKTSTLYKLLGAEEVMVNTSHNYSTYKIAAGLRVVATSPDGVVEALEGERFLGVQFHPEYLYGCHHRKQFLPIFEYLVKMAGENK